MVNTASDVKLNALSNALSFDPFAPLLSSEIALKVCPDFYCSPVMYRVSNNLLHGGHSDLGAS